MYVCIYIHTHTHIYMYKNSIMKPIKTVKRGKGEVG
jgi:hypothetical protein